MTLRHPLSHCKLIFESVYPRFIVCIPTVSADALNSSNCRSLHARASIVSFIILTYESCYRAKHRWHDFSVVHVIDVLRPDSWVTQQLAYYLKPVCHLVGNVLVVAAPVYRHYTSRCRLWVTFLESVGPVLTRRFEGFVCLRPRGWLRRRGRGCT
jgi:hypothetical protein